MSAPFPKALENEHECVTLIVLLVVMIIIGSLAAIAIPTTLNQRTNGWNSATKTDLSNMGLAAESSAVDKGGSFIKVVTINTLGTALSTGGVLNAANVVAGFGFTGGQSVDLTLGTVATANTFCVVGRSSSLGATAGWMTHSKARGGLQTTVVTSEADAQGQC